MDMYALRHMLGKSFSNNKTNTTMKKVQSGKSLFNKQILEQFVKNGWNVSSDHKNRLIVKTR